MGMFDSVWVPCPKCGTTSEFQSKSGECVLGNYTLADAPAEVLVDVNRHSPNQCEQCDTLFSVDGARNARVHGTFVESNDDLFKVDINFESLDIHELAEAMKIFDGAIRESGTYAPLAVYVKGLMKAAALTERERCAKVAESMPDGMWNHGFTIAKAIRERIK